MEISITWSYEADSPRLNNFPDLLFFMCLVLLRTPKLTGRRGSHDLSCHVMSLVIPSDVVSS